MDRVSTFEIADLADELMGHVTFTQMIFITLTGHQPEPPDEQLLDAVLVSLVDHGVNSSTLVTRLTYRAAPDALQGAIAAGVLNAGDRVLGAMENCGRMLSEGLSPGGDDAVDTARLIVTKYRDEDLAVPGLGHLLHKSGDPRATRLLSLAEELGRRGPYVQLLEAIAAELNKNGSRPVPINVTGAIAAVLLELGFDWHILRGFALMSRVVGLVAHVDEERLTGSAAALILDVMNESNAEHREVDSPGTG